MGKVAECEQGEVSVPGAAPGEPSSYAKPTHPTRPEGSVARGGPADKNAEPMVELSVGEIVDGKYRIQRVIGRGGMGIVYAAMHLTLHETVALKVLRPSMVKLPGMVTRFLREARATSRIKSEHVARVHDAAVLPSGVPYIVMEYLEGIELADLLRAVGPLPITDAVAYISEACHAVGEAHELGIIHRDLKPSNLFLADRRDGTRVLKVLDFGISKMYGTAEDTTQTGVTMGTPKYMSPEQMESLRSTDGRSDVWSLGAILYELLAGRPPFLGQSIVEMCMLVLQDEPPPFHSIRPDVPPALEAAVARCLRKAPEERFRTPDDLALALVPFCAPGSVKPRRASRPGAVVPEGAAPPSSRSVRRTQTSVSLHGPAASLVAPEAESPSSAPSFGLPIDRTQTSMSSRGLALSLRPHPRPARIALVAILAGLTLGGVGLFRSHREEQAARTPPPDGTALALAAGAQAAMPANAPAADAGGAAPEVTKPAAGAPAVSGPPTRTRNAASRAAGGKPPVRDGQPPPSSIDPFGGSRN